MENNELLRFTTTSSAGVTFLLPPKLEFVFYADHLEAYDKKGKQVKNINYADITEVAIMKTWQAAIFINCKPIGFNIYKVTDEQAAKIKQIIGK